MCLVVQKQEKSRASLLEENLGHGVGTVRLLTETAGMKEEGDFQILQLHMARVSVTLQSPLSPSLFASGSPRITILYRGMEFKAAPITSTDDLHQSRDGVLMFWFLGVVLPLLTQCLGLRPGNVHCDKMNPSMTLTCTQL